MHIRIKVVPSVILSDKIAHGLSESDHGAARVTSMMTRRNSALTVGHHAPLTPLYTSRYPTRIVRAPLADGGMQRRVLTEPLLPLSQSLRFLVNHGWDDDSTV